MQQIPPSPPQNQLRDLLVSSGFPEDLLMPQMYNFRGGEDPALDVATGILTMGHYPNVCYHLEKRKLITQVIILINKDIKNNK